MCARQTRTVRCAVCGAEFKTDLYNKKHCSNSCKAEYDRRMKREHKDERHVEEAAMRREARKGRVCAVCGKVFDATSARNVFCSVRCRAVGMARRARGVDMRDCAQKAKCEKCGKEFLLRGAKHRFCSAECYKSHVREIQRIRYDAKRASRSNAMPAGGRGILTVAQARQVEADMRLPHDERYIASKSWTSRMRAYAQRLYSNQHRIFSHYQPTHVY